MTESGPKVQTLQTPDGANLGYRLFETEEGTPHRMVVINSAMGVRQTYYNNYARYLASSGFAAVTYDYRGLGDSAGPGGVRQSPATLRDWGRDFDAILDHMEEQYQGLPIVIVGHSVGGQIVGLLSRPSRIHALLGVAAQSGYWKHWSGPSQLKMFALWHLIIPFVCATLGYLPSQLFGSGEHIPPGVARQWGQAGRQRRYIKDRFVDDSSFDRVRIPIRLMGFSDDSFAPKDAVAGLAKLYPNARVELQQITPGPEHGQKIDHFGFFRSRMKDSLWADSAAWLRRI